MTMHLPIEIVAHIFDVAIHSNANSPSDLANLSMVNHSVRQKAQRQLYRNVRLCRQRIKPFISTLKVDAQNHKDNGVKLSDLVKDVAFISSSASAPNPALDAPQYDAIAKYEHEHVDLVDVLHCLSLVRGSVEGICIDMACSQVACGWYSDPAISDQGLTHLTLPKLGRLSCRCPKGYLPTCARKVLDLFHLGHSPFLTELLLYWTGPGSSFDAPDNAESLTKTLQACPNVCRLSIIKARYVSPDSQTTLDEAETKLDTNPDESAIISPSTASDVDSSSSASSPPLKPNGRLKNGQICHSQEVWIKSTSANGAVYRAPSLEAAVTSDSTSDVGVDGVAAAAAARMLRDSHLNETEKAATQAMLRVSSQGVLASQAQHDSDAAPTAVGDSIARAARRIDRRKNTLRAHIATINVPALAAVAAAETSVVEVQGSTHGNHVPLTSPSSSSPSIPPHIISGHYNLKHDDGWSALITLLQDRSQPAIPAPP